MADVSFRAHGNIVYILGKSLIDELSVAVLELVKNGYDADATTVEVKLENIYDPHDARVIIHDNGVGMSFRDITERYLVAAYSDKHERVLRHERTPRGRFPLGRMGIGRFAAARLGRRLILVTRSAGHPELRLTIDWDAIAQADDLQLARIPVVEETEPKIFPNDRTGTRLAILSPHTPWRRADLLALRTQLRRFISPYTALHDFRIQLSIPDSPELEDLEWYREHIASHFECKAIIESDGKGSFTWKNHLSGAAANEQIDFWASLRQSQKEDRQKPDCGPFQIHLHAWKGTKTELRKFGIDNPDHLDEITGISIFRDGFRVLPYGDPGHDWLDLNMRRVQDPSKRFSTNRILGSVSISTEHNPELMDQANRLGLIENQAAQDFRNLVLAVIAAFEDRCLKGVVPVKSDVPSPASPSSIANDQGRLQNSAPNSREKSTNSGRQKTPTVLKEGPATQNDTGAPETENPRPIGPVTIEQIFKSGSTKSSKDEALDLLTEAVDLIRKLKTQVGWHREALDCIHHAEQDFNHAFEILSEAQ